MEKDTKLVSVGNVRKIIDKKAQANKCPSMLQFPGKIYPRSQQSAHFSIIIYSRMEKGTKLVPVGM